MEQVRTRRMAGPEPGALELELGLELELELGLGLELELGVGVGVGVGQGLRMVARLGQGLRARVLLAD